MKINFKGVSSTGGSVLLPEGEYVASVTGVESGKYNVPYLDWAFVIGVGGSKGKKINSKTFLSEKALYKLKNLLESAGIEVPDGELDFKAADIKGKPIGLYIVERDYVKNDGSKGKSNDVLYFYKVVKKGNEWIRVEDGEIMTDKEDTSEQKATSEAMEKIEVPFEL